VRTRELVTVILLCLWACASCGEPPPVDTSLLTGEPCEPPCWQGLVAGVSTEDEAERLLTSSGLVNRDSIYRGSLSRGGETVGVSIQWLSTANVQGAHARNSFSMEDGILRDMTIWLDAEVSLAELIDGYGPPEKYLAALSGIHFTEVRVSLFYPEDGFTARVELPRHDASLRPDTNVASVWYFKSASLDRFLELGRDNGHFGANVQPEALSDWEGYGPVEVQ
jgi:hypothetical protein